MGKFEDILWETWRISWGNFVESYGVSLEVQFVGIQRVELRMIPLGLVARGGSPVPWTPYFGGVPAEPGHGRTSFPTFRLPE